MMRARFVRTAGVAVTLFVLAGSSAAASAPSSADGSAAGATKVSVVLKEWSLKASKASVPAGKVTFIVRNAGKLTHEFVVIRTNKPAGALPVKGGQASEVGAKGEIKAFGPGKTKRLTLKLAPGKYVLLCNLPGHYKLGQVMAFTVTGAATASPSPARNSKVNVSAFEMAFKLSANTVPHGTVVFTVTNTGKLPHDFSFGSRGGGTPMLQPGQSATLTVKFDKPGKYIYICTVPGHQEAGMIGALTVT